MRITKIICPKCQASLTSKAGVEVGTAIACPKCQQKFKVAAPEDEETVDDFEAVDDEEEAPKKPARPTTKKRVENREDEEKPRPKKRREDGDDENRPKTKKRKLDGDDNDRPRKKKKKRREEELGVYGRLKNNIWVRAGLLGALLLILGIVVYLKVLKNQEQEVANPTPATAKKDSEPEKPTATVPKSGKMPVDGDMEKLKGTWEMQTVLTGVGDKILDKNVPVAVIWAFRVNAVSGASEIFLSTKPGLFSSLIIDSNKSPAVIDINYSDKTPTDRGIYRFVDNDTLEICIRIGPGQRPKSFLGNNDNNILTYKVKRRMEKSP